MIYTKEKRSYVKPELEAVWMDNEALLDGNISAGAGDQPAEGEWNSSVKRNVVRINQWDDWDDEEEEDDGWVY